MKEFKDPQRRKTAFNLTIKGGSPDLVIELDPMNFNQNLGFFKKIQRGTIVSRLRLKLRYFDTISDEGKFNISLLPST
jgi:hypothetical protein